jgi:hypothetical protein
VANGSGEWDDHDTMQYGVLPWQALERTNSGQIVEMVVFNDCDRVAMITARHLMRFS